MASIFALEKNEQRDFVKVPRPAQSKFCEIENAHYVKCYTIEQYSVMENIELCTMFCSDENFMAPTSIKTQYTFLRAALV